MTWVTNMTRIKYGHNFFCREMVESDIDFFVLPFGLRPYHCTPASRIFTHHHKIDEISGMIPQREVDKLQMGASPVNNGKRN
jgi:hypothetical protein